MRGYAAHVRLYLGPYLGEVLLAELMVGKVQVSVGYPHVAAVRGDSDGFVETVAGPGQHADQGAGGGIQLGHRVAGCVGYPDAGAVRGDGVRIVGRTCLWNGVTAERARHMLNLPGSGAQDQERQREEDCRRSFG